jgi:hypothetical protein
VTGRRGRRCKQLLDDVKEMIGYWKFEKERYIALRGEVALEEAWDLSEDNT